MKNTTLCNNYDKGGQKNVDISSKIISLQCSWIKKLYNNTNPSCKAIRLHLIKTNLGLNSKFHLNLDISIQKPKKFPIYYKNVLQN